MLTLKGNKIKDFCMVVKRILQILFFLLFCHVGFSDIDGFTPYKIGDLTPGKLHELNCSKDIFVYENEGKLAVSSLPKNNASKLKIDSGLLIAVDFGEFGGYLEFFNDSEKSVFFKVSNIKKIFEIEGCLYFAVGLYHINIDSGNIQRLELGKRLNCEKIFDFDSAVRVVEVRGSKIYTVCSSKFVVLENFTPKFVLEAGFWSLLYPNSIVVFDDENIFVGMRSGIAKINAVKANIEFYLHTGEKIPECKAAPDADIEKSLARWNLFRKSGMNWSD